MLKIKDEGIILTKTELDFENRSVWNPACISVDGIIHMLYRATNKKGISSIGYCQLKDNKVIKRNTEPLIFPEFDYEKHSIEDPRITFLDGNYYLFYVAFDGKNARTAYAAGPNINALEKRGLISSGINYEEAFEIFKKSKLSEAYFIKKIYSEDPIYMQSKLLWQKDVVLFPKKINGKFAILYRIRPGIQIVYFDRFSDLTDEFWLNYLNNFKKFIVMEPCFSFENKYIGAGCPPIETADGWLVIYHAVEIRNGEIIYHAAAALLDYNDPTKIIGRLKRPLFSPKTEWEKQGITDNVIFPTGTTVDRDTLTIYYGAADQVIGAKSLSLSELLRELKKE